MITINVHVDKEHKETVTIKNVDEASNPLPTPLGIDEIVTTINALPLPTDDKVVLQTRNDLPRPPQQLFDERSAGRSTLPRPEEQMTELSRTEENHALPTPHDVVVDDDIGLPQPISANKRKKQSKK